MESAGTASGATDPASAISSAMAVEPGQDRRLGLDLDDGATALQQLAAPWVPAFAGMARKRRLPLGYAVSPSMTSFTFVASCLREKGLGRKWMLLSLSRRWRKESSV